MDTDVNDVPTGKLVQPEITWLSDSKTNGDVFLYVESRLRDLAPLPIQTLYRQMRDRYSLSLQEIEQRRAHNESLQSDRMQIRRAVYLRISLNVQNPTRNAYCSHEEGSNEAYQVVLFRTIKQTLVRETNDQTKLENLLSVLPEIWNEIRQEIDGITKPPRTDNV